MPNFNYYEDPEGWIKDQNEELDQMYKKIIFRNLDLLKTPEKEWSIVESFMKEDKKGSDCQPIIPYQKISKRAHGPNQYRYRDGITIRYDPRANKGKEYDLIVRDNFIPKIFLQVYQRNKGVAGEYYFVSVPKIKEFLLTCKADENIWCRCYDERYRPVLSFVQRKRYRQTSGDDHGYIRILHTELEGIGAIIKHRIVGEPVTITGDQYLNRNLLV